MELRWVNIKNYRSCKDVHIEIGPMQAPVGANNAGVGAWGQSTSP